MLSDTTASEEPTPTRVQPHEDEGRQLLLHRLRMSSRQGLPHPDSRTRGSILFPRFELSRPARVLAGPLLSPSPFWASWWALPPFRPHSHSPSFVDLYFYYNYVRLEGRGPQVGPFPSRPILGSIRREGTPPPPQQTLAVS